MEEDLQMDNKLIKGGGGEERKKEEQMLRQLTLK